MIVTAQPAADLLPIPQVQGSGASSPYAGTSVAVAGVITGIQRTGESAGFFLQDPTGDGDELTSDGIYVRMPGSPASWLSDVSIGTRATVTGKVSERGGLTAIEAAAKGALQVGRRAPAASPLQPTRLEVPADQGARVEYLESREGMLVTIPTALVVGPTNPWGQYVAVDEQLHGPRRLGSSPDTTGYVHVNGRLGPKSQLTVGDRIEGMRGPLGITRGQFEVLPVGNYKALERGPRPPRAFGDIDGDDNFGPRDRTAIASRVGQPSSGPLDAADLNGDGKISRADINRLDARIERQRGGAQLSIATLNAFNFFDPDDAPAPIDDDVPSANEYRTKLAKLAGTIRDTLGSPDVLALQEVENTRVLDDLLARPELAGLGYRYAQLPTTGRRSINPTLLFRESAGELLGVRQLRPQDRQALASEELVLDPPPGMFLADATQGAAGILPLGAGAAARAVGPLFSREPLIVDLKVQDPRHPEVAPRELTFVVNHLISKFSPHGVPTEPVRVDQANAVRELVEQLRAERPDREVVVLGDMNDVPGSKAIRALQGPARTPTLVNAITEFTPEAERYSYIYDGASELIDHVLVTPGLADAVTRAGVRHGNADLPRVESWDSSPARSSDHDSPYIWLDLAAPAARPAPPATRKR